MLNDKFVGYKVSFKMGKFSICVYMEKDEYETWKTNSDKGINDVSVEEVEIALSYFLN
ncbi:hypothetical protein Back11_30080 [Paenibacillus baekrokdamisoli]|uniref:Uncharacterized protein n=1 Tax=Paenibacillus baekrokdamisoli TaxID=1712516 RepID=A0A3G9J9V1_9BACL|nr:hypothetical protein [Paenibacillus baekrokdamisoli]MBB3071246.1 hypothetical protein [Paenibacillus baekrokdamisoli]BBH21663.1 hypothetical protein Back11_30080 [Paenibacillus baekrokdamisoli]